jgi:hypothetical protein
MRMETKGLSEKAMMNSTFAAAFAVCLLFCAPAFAQSNGTSSGADQSQGDSQAQAPSAEGDQAAAADRTPILHVISVEIMRSTHGPTLDVLRVRGLTSTDGWDEGELIALTRGTPSDGMLDLVFVARPPSESAEATGFGSIEALFPIETGHPYKGVRVHSASAAVSLTQMPGYVDGEAAGEDCSKCVGKYFVAKGGSLPSGVSDADAVREEQLPANLRVIKATDGLGKLETDPNRLTIVVGTDGRIVGAFWG